MITRTYFICMNVNGHSRHRIFYNTSWFDCDIRLRVEYELSDYAKYLDVDPNTIKITSLNRV